MSRLATVLLMLASLVASYCGIAWFLRFARRRQLFDVPNDRSSHSVPTPRGGGVVFAIVFSLAVAVLAAMRIISPQETIAALAALLVAAVGYWDDRTSLKATTRLAVQAVSACIAVGALTTTHQPGIASSSVVVIAVLTAIEVVGLIWVLNLTNFMDGIDGIVAIQAVTVSAFAAALVVAKHGFTVPALLFLLLGAAVLPFLLFNWSPARLFMGDAGSGYLGFMLGVLTLIAVARHQIFLMSPVILMGVFLADATTTLVTRYLRGERWLSPHSTHAYQILARRYGHKTVSAGVGLVNLLWLLPIAALANLDPHHGIVYVVAALMPLVVASYVVRATSRPTAPLRLPATTAPEEAAGQTGKLGLFRQVVTVLHRYSSFVQLIAIGIFTVPCVYGAIWLHFDGAIPHPMLAVLSQVVVLWSVTQGAVLVFFRIHRSHWRFTSAEELPRLVAISVFASVAGFFTAALSLRMYDLPIPMSVYLIEALLSLVAFIGLRVLSRLIYGLTGMMLQTGTRRRILIYCADVSGVSILSEVRRRCPYYRPIGFIDDRPEMKGRYVYGLRVLGTLAEFEAVAKKQSIDRVLIGAKSYSEAGMTQVREACRRAEVDLRVVTSFAESEVQLQKHLARDFAIEELLGRPPVAIDASLVAGQLQGRVVMVTGAAGSIGSELCRQIAAFNPSAIVGYEISETGLFFLERELRDRFPSVPFMPCIGSVQNEQRLSEVVAAFRPEVVYHAAAYKHVPLMEQHLFEAIENNIAATQTLLRVCETHGVSTLLMISSDKAVRPTSLMGATKRVAELIVRASSLESLTCVSTRFGNVLGSSGSVIPIFRSQILAGGPVKVTDPAMVRYFMTIPEAAQLVLQASSLGARSEIFVLAMGEPVRIVDLAERMIRLMGYTPGNEIAIEFTGMRPGEKLYEELNTSDEETVPTSHPKIFVFKDPAARGADVLAQVDQLKAACEERQAAKALKILQSIVPDYVPSKEIQRAVALMDSVTARTELGPLTLAGGLSE